jgi:hypothetical protein
METRDRAISRIRANLPFGNDPGCDLREDTVLSDLGVTSLHLVTMLTSIQREYRLTSAAVMGGGFPRTIGDILKIIECNTPLS